jgi:uncharacterized protein
MIQRLLLFFVRAYQVLVSPFKVSSCRFFPTCSQYTYDAIRFYGPLAGVVMGMKRVTRCHPFHPGGYDPVVEPPPDYPSQY